MPTNPLEDVAEDILDAEAEIWRDIKTLETYLGYLKRDLEKYQELRKIL